MELSHSNSIATIKDGPNIYNDENPIGAVDQGQGYWNRDRAKYFFSAKQKKVISIDTENLEISDEFLFSNNP
jgi:hypothetical protein